MNKPKKTFPKMPDKITAHYVKTAGYRSYHVDGIFGGITPNGKIYAELFIQRAATPQSIDYAVGPDGSLGKEISREGKDGLIREIEAGIVMDIQTAQVIRDWLDKRLEDIKKLDAPVKKKGRNS